MHAYTRWKNPTPYVRKIEDKDMSLFILLLMFGWALLLWLILYDLARLLLVSRRKSGRMLLREVFVRFPTEVLIAFCMVAWYLHTYWKKVTG